MIGHLKYALIAVLAVLLSSCNTEKSKEAIPWRTDLSAAQAEAQRLHKPVFIDCAASWCGPCQQMARDTWSDPAVAAALQGMVPVKIDVDQQPDLAAKYARKGIPAFRVLDAEGKTIKSAVGYMPPKEFLAWLNAKSETGDGGE